MERSVLDTQTHLQPIKVLLVYRSNPTGENVIYICRRQRFMVVLYKLDKVVRLQHKPIGLFHKAMNIIGHVAVCQNVR